MTGGTGQGLKDPDYGVRGRGEKRRVEGEMSGRRGAGQWSEVGQRRMTVLC
jgi:hypothetical protein